MVDSGFEVVKINSKYIKLIVIY